MLFGAARHPARSVFRLNKTTLLVGVGRLEAVEDAIVPRGTFDETMTAIGIGVMIVTDVTMIRIGVTIRADVMIRIGVMMIMITIGEVAGRRRNNKRSDLFNSFRL